jgi:hypothetical protein
MMMEKGIRKEQTDEQLFVSAEEQSCSGNWKTRFF